MGVAREGDGAKKLGEKESRRADSCSLFLFLPVWRKHAKQQTPQRTRGTAHEGHREELNNVIEKANHRFSRALLENDRSVQIDHQELQPLFTESQKSEKRRTSWQFAEYERREKQREAERKRKAFFSFLFSFFSLRVLHLFHLLTCSTPVRPFCTARPAAVQPSVSSIPAK